MSDLFDEMEPKRSAASRSDEVRSHVEHVRRERRRKRRINTFITSFLVMVITATLVVLLPQFISGEEKIRDYPGPGSEAVMIEIPEGATGRDMASILQEEGVVATSKAFVDAYNNDPRAASIQPGMYNLKMEMSGAGAVSALLDPASKADQKVTIPEGWPKWQVFKRLDSALGLPEGSSEEAAKGDIGLPEEAGGEVEGWFAPLTYTFAPETTAEEALSTMVQARVDQLDELGIPRERWQADLIKGSILEREAGSYADLHKVARVIENRLKDKSQVMGKLQMDSTVLYGLGIEGGVPTRDQLAEDTPFNTYLHAGLPPTPIGATGLDALEAVENPAKGDWLYFVTVNLESGETKFSSNYDEHKANVEEFKKWVKENPQG